MVRWGAAAQQASHDRGEALGSDTGETLERQEARVSQRYQRCLTLVKEQRQADAIEGFLSALQDEAFSRDLLGDQRFSQLRNIKYLIIKNLAQLAEQAGVVPAAVEWFTEAVTLDDRDFLVWFKLGCSALAIQKLNVARRALEMCMMMRPRHVNCRDKLCEALFIIGDLPACLAAAEDLIQIDRTHIRAHLFQGLVLRERAHSRYEGEDILHFALQADGMKAELKRLEALRSTRLVAKSEFVCEAKTVRLESWTWEELLQKIISIFLNAGKEDAEGHSYDLNVPVHFDDPQPVGDGLFPVQSGRTSKGPSQFDPDGAVCSYCGGDCDSLEDELLLCENLETCGGAYHLTCLSPPYGPLEKPPPQKVKWFCPDCESKRTPCPPNPKKRPCDSTDPSKSKDDAQSEECSAAVQDADADDLVVSSPAKRRKSRGADPERKSRRHTDQRSAPTELQLQLGRILTFLKFDDNDDEALRLDRSESESMQIDEASTVEPKASERNEDKPSEESIDLTRYQMLQHFDDALRSQGTEVKAFLESLPLRCGLLDLLRRLLCRLTALCQSSRVRGKLLELMLEVDKVTSSSLQLPADVRLTLAELHFDLFLKKLQTNNSTSAVDIDTENRETAADEDGERQVDEVPMHSKHLQHIWSGCLPDQKDCVRHAWLVARLKQNSLRNEHACEGFEDVKVLFESLMSDANAKILLPSCTFGNQISSSTIQSCLKSPKAGAESQNIANLLSTILPCLDKPLESEDSAVTDLINRLLSLIAPELQDPNTSLVKKAHPSCLSEQKDTENKRWEYLTQAYETCRKHPGYHRQAVYVINLFLADLVGIEDVLALKEDPNLYRGLTGDGVKHAKKAVEMARSFVDPQFISSCMELDGVPRMLRQLEIQFARLVIKLGATKAAVIDFHGATMHFFRLYLLLHPNSSSSQQQEMLAVVMEEFLRRGIHNYNDGEFFSTYLPLLYQLRRDNLEAEKAKAVDPEQNVNASMQLTESSRQSPQNNVDHNAESDGSGDEDDDEDSDDEDKVSQEIAKCYFAMFGFRIPHFNNVYDELEALIGRDDDTGSRGGRLSRNALTLKAEMCLDLYEFVRPFAEKSKRSEQNMKEVLEHIEKLFPTPPSKIAPASEIVKSFIAGPRDKSLTVEVLVPDFMSVYRAWDRQHNPQSVETVRSDVIVIDDDESRAGSNNDVRMASGDAETAHSQGGFDVAGKDRLETMYRTLYSLLARLSERQKANDTGNDERVVDLYARDLRMHPLSRASWLGMAQTLKKMLLACGNHGLRSCTTLQQSPEAMDRLRRASRAFSAAASVDPAADADGRYGRGLMLYLAAQGARAHGQETRRALLTAALRDFERCLDQRGGATGWLLHYMTGKILRKVGGPEDAEACLDHLFEAARLTSETGLLGIEPFYKLHATRAKLLLQPPLPSPASSGSIVASGSSSSVDLAVLERFSVTACIERARDLSAAVAAGTVASGESTPGRVGSGGSSAGGVAGSLVFAPALVEDSVKAQQEVSERIRAAASAAAGISGEMVETTAVLSDTRSATQLAVLEDVMVAMRIAIDKARNQRPSWPFAKGRYRLAKTLTEAAPRLAAAAVPGMTVGSPAGCAATAAAAATASEVVSNEVLFRLFFNERDDIHAQAWGQFSQFQAKQAEQAEFSTVSSHARLRHKTAALLVRQLADCRAEVRICERLERMLDLLIRVDKTERIPDCLRGALDRYLTALQRLLLSSASAAACPGVAVVSASSDAGVADILANSTTGDGAEAPAATSSTLATLAAAETGHEEEVFKRAGKLRSTVAREAERRDVWDALVPAVEPPLAAYIAARLALPTASTSGPATPFSLAPVTSSPAPGTPQTTPAPASAQAQALNTSTSVLGTPVPNGTTATPSVAAAVATPSASAVRPQVSAPVPTTKQPPAAPTASPLREIYALLCAAGDRLYMARGLPMPDLSVDPDAYVRAYTEQYAEKPRVRLSISASRQSPLSSKCHTPRHDIPASAGRATPTPVGGDSADDGLHTPACTPSAASSVAPAAVAVSESMPAAGVALEEEVRMDEGSAEVELFEVKVPKLPSAAGGTFVAQLPEGPFLVTVPSNVPEGTVLTVRPAPHGT